MFGSTERRKVRLISRELISEEFQLVITVHQRYRWTDGETTYHGNTALCYASHGNDASFVHFDIISECHRWMGRQTALL